MKVLDLNGTLVPAELSFVGQSHQDLRKQITSLPLGLCFPSPQEGSKLYAPQLHSCLLSKFQTGGSGGDDLKVTALKGTPFPHGMELSRWSHHN